MKRNLLSDINSTTRLSSALLSKLTNISELIVCDCINELDISGEEMLEISIGIGTITFIVTGDTIQYKFTPSNSLEEKIIYTLENKVTPIVNISEHSLEQKIKNTYKELF